MIHSPILPAFVASLLFIAAPALAQSSAERDRLAAFTDSLGRLARSAEVQAIVERPDQGAGASDPVERLRRGFALLRLAALDQSGRRYDRARNAFQEADRLKPRWPYPRYGIGLAERAKGDWLAAEPLSLGSYVGHGAYRAAFRALASVVADDPGFTPAILELAAVSALLRDTLTALETRAILSRAIARGNQDRGVLRLLARSEWAAGHHYASIATLESARQSSREDALLGYELVRARFTAGEDASRAYFDLAGSDDPATLASLRADLLLLARPSELERLDAARGPERAAALRTFWETRARQDLRSVPERLTEHFRRLQYAGWHYGLMNNRRFYSLRDVFRAGESAGLDDRGVVYLRHGAPARRVTPLLFGLMPAETWLYRRADGDLLLHFSGGGAGPEGGALTDYRLVGSAEDLRGSGIPRDLLLLELSRVSDLYLKMMSWGPHGSARIGREEREWGTWSARVGTGSESYQLRFTDSLGADFDLLTIGRSNGSPQLQVLFTLPGGAGDGNPVRLRLAFFDASGTAVHWMDTTIAPVRAGEAMGARVAAPAPPGRWRYRLSLEQGAAGMVTTLDSVVVPDLIATPLAVSSIALGRSQGNLSWIVGPADTALLHPAAAYRVGESLQLYAEVYGLAEGESFEATVAVFDENRGRRGRNRLGLTVQEEGRGEVTRIRRTIQLAGLGPGLYLLSLTIRGSGGPESIAERAFMVLPVAP